MTDKILVADGQLELTTDEGRTLTMPEERLVQMLRAEIEPPTGEVALPDGVKFIQWQAPFMCVVHQLPAHVRQLRWITDDSPVPYGPGTKFKTRRLSLPYAITFAIYYRRRTRLGLMGYNELYFRNEPLKTKHDRLGFAALLNVSRINTRRRPRAWICTQHLRCPPDAQWDAQLAALLDHTWNGAFNLSSEHHEGASWYGESQGIHPDLHPVQNWEKATSKNDAFALTVPWKPAPLTVGQLIEAMLTECAEKAGRHQPAARAKNARSIGLATRLVSFAQNAQATS